MLKIFTGEHLENVQNCESLGLNELDSQKTIVDKVTAFIQNTNCFETNNVAIRTNNPVVIKTIEVIMAEQEAYEQVIVYMIDDEKKQHELHYDDEGFINASAKYQPGNVLLQLNNRFYRTIYDRRRKNNGL